MKNLGYFDPKAVELFEANFSENLEFSEDTESYDFARCQRPDGSFYGTSGQCRKGTNVKQKEANESRSTKMKAHGAKTRLLKEELEKRRGEMKGASSETINKLLKEANDAANKRAAAGEGKAEGKKAERPAPTTKAQAQARRRAAVVNALDSAKLPGNPPAYKRELNKRLKARPGYQEAASALKSADKEAAKAERNLRKAEEPLRKKGGANATPEEKAAYKAAQQEARAANTAYEKARRAEKKIRDEETRKLNQEVSKVVTRAEREARAKEPVVGTEMGGKKRLGDADITTSPRD